MLTHPVVWIISVNVISPSTTLAFNVCARIGPITYDSSLVTPSGLDWSSYRGESRQKLGSGEQPRRIRWVAPSFPGDSSTKKSRSNKRKVFGVSVAFTIRQSNEITIIDLKGRIVLGEGSVTVRDTVHDLLTKGQKRILLNLGAVNYIDSSGIGELVSAFAAAKKQGGELKLLNLNKRIHDLLQITKLYTVFDVKDDEASAVESFSM